MKNGELDPWQIRKNTAGGVAGIRFDNAILRAQSGASNAFFGGLDNAEIQSGGLVIDAMGDVVIAQDLSGPGFVVKSNWATVTLTGSNTYAGNTIVREGKLVLPAGRTYVTHIQVWDNAELGIAVQSADTTLTNTAMTLGQSGSSSLSFDLGAFPNPTGPLMKVGALSANGVVNIHLANGLGLSRGRIVLIDYEGTIGGGRFWSFQGGATCRRGSAPRC